MNITEYDKEKALHRGNLRREITSLILQEAELPFTASKANLFAYIDEEDATSCTLHTTCAELKIHCKKGENGPTLVVKFEGTSAYLFNTKESLIEKIDKKMLTIANDYEILKKIIIATQTRLELISEMILEMYNNDNLFNKKARK